jgi:acetyl-CoA decarbonylase/synthase complex subunit beta
VCIDPETGEYEGVNRVVKEKSLSDVSRVQLYTAFGYPHTSCGCFECTTFYIPECDGLGIVNRDFRGVTPTGLSFGSIADSTGGGRQVDGFHGLSFEYMRSPRFLRASGGWERIVWMPSDVREKLKAFIPSDLYDQIATEKDVTSMDEMMVFLRAHHHPIIGRTAGAELNISDTAGTTTESKREIRDARSLSQGPGAGVSITFHNIRLHADRVFVRKGRK